MPQLPRMDTERLRSIEEYGFDPTAQAQALQYTNATTVIALLNHAVVLLMALALGAVSRPLFTTIAHGIHPYWAQEIFYTFLVFVAIQSSHLIPYWLGYKLEIDFGLSQPVPHARWWAIGELILVSVLGTIFFILVYALASPIWRGVQWGSVGPIIIYLTYTQVSKWGFGPPGEGRRLTDPQWERVQEIAKRVRVKAPRVTVMDSRQHKRLWATFFTWSFFERIYVSQVLLDQLSPAEVDVVFAHELAHKRYEIIQILMFYLAWVIPTMIAVIAFLPSLAALYGVNRGVESLPLFIFLVEGALFAIRPVTSATSRWIERRADRLALHAIGDPDVFASTMVKLYDHNLIPAAPGRVWQLFFGTHPAGVERVRLVRSWKTNPQKRSRTPPSESG